MSTADLAERAAATHITVIGGGIAGLVAARECAKVGMRVTLLEAGAHLGGTIRTVQLGELTVDAGADSFSLRGGHAPQLIDELGLSGATEKPAPARTAIAGIPGVGVAPLPQGQIIGVPENPFDEQVRRIIGWRGAWRAYLDRLRPPLTIGHADSLGRLVGSRMGALVRDRLVAPLTVGGFAIDPDDVDPDIAAPGLNAALTRTGSLSGAVLQLRGERAEKGESDAAPHSLRGGMGRLVDALRAELDLLGATVRTDARALSVARAGDGWAIEVEASDPDSETGDLLVETVVADALLVATPEAEARALLADLVPGLAPESPAVVLETVTLLVEGPGLDDAPLEVFTIPGSRAATALRRTSALWSWLGEAAAGRHVIRVTFGGPGTSPATEALDESDAAALALAEATALLGLSTGALTLVSSARERFVQARAVSALGAGEERAASRQAIAQVQGLGVVGAWLAGTGLAQVIPDAAAEADRLRRALLWGASPASRQ